MDQYMEVIRKCKNFPQKVNPAIQKDIRLYPVCPDEFAVISEELVLSGAAADSIEYLQLVTERHGQEQALTLYGERHVNSLYMRDCHIEAGTANSASFNTEQLHHAKRIYKKAHGEVVYAHSHVARGVSYNCFSVNDLIFLVKQAMHNKRDVYAILVTKDRITPIKYSLAKNEFFRIQIVLA